MPAPVLVVHGDKKAQRQLARVISTGVGPVQVYDRLTGARAPIAGAAAVVVGLSVAAGDGFGAFAAAARAAAVPVLLCGEAGPAEVLTLVRDHALDHVLAADPVVFADELPLTLRGLAPDADLATHGAARYLSHGAVLAERMTTSTHGRLATLATVRDGLSTMGLSARHERQAVLLADELLANAIFDAPVGADGRLPPRDGPRDPDRALSPHAQPRLRWGSDGRMLAIEVTDRFGTLAAETIRAHVAKLIDRSTTPRAGDGGAGLGLAMCFLAASQLVFHLDAGRLTQAIGLIELRPRPDGPRAMVPSLHVFSRSHAGGRP